MTPSAEDAPLPVLLVDDDPGFRTALADSFAIAGIEVELHSEGHSAIASLAARLPGVVITDLRMPRTDGHAVMEAALARDPELPVILMTGHGDVATAVSAMKQGAHDFITKPFASDHMIASVRRALETRRLVLENRRLRQAVADSGDATYPLIGDSPAMLRLRQTMRQIAPVDVDVLIEGETGTGKALVAAQIHRWSLRRNRAFVVVDCAALPEAIAEETLFGSRIHRGQIAEADRGTLFLDGVDALPPALQTRLASVVEDRILPAPAGSPAGTAPRAVDIRILAATREDLTALVSEGRFRAELLYRLETVRLRIPPLRERREDLPLLFSAFLDEAALLHGRPRPAVDAIAVARLMGDDWKGNARELRNYATQLLLGLGGDHAAALDLPLTEQIDRFEAGVLTTTLAHVKGDITAACALLQIPRRSLYARLSQHGIAPGDFRNRG